MDQDTIDVYDRIAAGNSKDIENLQIPEIDEFCSLLPKGSKVLDAGCAAGRDSASMHSRGMEIIGIDLSEGLLNIARKREGPRFLKMDMALLEFPDCYFDGVWCNASLLHLKRDEAKGAMSEFARVLKRGGKLFLSLKKGEGTTIVKEELSQEQGRRFYYYSEKEAKELVVKSGLTVSKFSNRKSESRPVEWLYIFAEL